MSREKLTDQIKNTLLEIDHIVSDMINVSEMVGGSFGITFRKCGKANCWCRNAEKKGHPFLRITYVENKKSRTKAIPKKDEEWIKKRTDHYKIFRQNFQKLRQCEITLNDLLNHFEKDVKAKTAQLRDYL